MKGIYREKIEYLNAKYRTREGIFTWVIGSIIWGFVIVNYTSAIYGFFLNALSFLPIILQEYLSYLLFGISLVPLGIAITYTLAKLYWVFFDKNGKVI